MKAADLPADYAQARDRLHEAIDDRLVEAAGTGQPVQILGDLDDLVVRVGAAIPHPHPLADLIGPCYDTAGLVGWLGVSKQSLDKRNRAGTILACRTSDGRWVYPAFQFDAAGRTLPHLRELIALLSGPEQDRWRAAQWLAAPSPDLPKQVSAAAWLAGGGDPEPVLAAARADAARWAA